MINPAKAKGLEINNDIKILMTAVNYDNNRHPDETIFVTNDLSLKRIANLFFGEDSITSVKVDNNSYTGYLDLVMSEDEMATFYSDMKTNHYDLYNNEYLIIRDKDNQIIDRLCWTGTEYRQLKYSDFPSKQFGKKMKAYAGDVYQALAVDSLFQNKITMITGPAGSGKTYLSLGFLFHKLEKGDIDKIVIFCNTVATKNSAKLGFYPGSRDEKLLDSQIGNLLVSKIGSRVEVERLIEDETLALLPLSDIRGYDTSGMKAGVYISEAQNLDINMMKLALQRIGEDSICIIDGDTDAQVDLPMYADFYNGMKRASKIFRGSDIYGEVKLQKIHRSKIANIADKM
jgi:predicted ribonuclease YlaK